MAPMIGPGIAGSFAMVERSDIIVDEFSLTQPAAAGRRGRWAGSRNGRTRWREPVGHETAEPAPGERIARSRVGSSLPFTGSEGLRNFRRHATAWSQWQAARSGQDDHGGEDQRGSSVTSTPGPPEDRSHSSSCSRSRRGAQPAPAAPPPDETGELADDQPVRRPGHEQDFDHRRLQVHRLADGETVVADTTSSSTASSAAARLPPAAGAELAAQAALSSSTLPGAARSSARRSSVMETSTRGFDEGDDAGSGPARSGPLPAYRRSGGGWRPRRSADAGQADRGEHVKRPSAPGLPRYQAGRGGGYDHGQLAAATRSAD